MTTKRKSKIALPKLAKGEIYVGGTIDASGRVTHTILLPGEKADVQWKDALAWAQKEGGDLPTRIEQAILWAHHRKLFETRYYWSNEQDAGDVACAWYQSFDYGNQFYWHEDGKGMARAVRRVVI